MANIKSAKKAVIQSRKRHAVNVARKTAIKTAIKKVTAALQDGKSAQEVQALFNAAQAQCARAKGKHTLHRKTASRKVSRLALKVQAHFAAEPVVQPTVKKSKTK